MNGHEYSVAVRHEKTCQQSGITESAIRLHLIPEVKQKLNLIALQNFHDQFFLYYEKNPFSLNFSIVFIYNLIFSIIS